MADGISTLGVIQGHVNGNKIPIDPRSQESHAQKKTYDWIVWIKYQNHVKPLPDLLVQ